MVVLLFSRKIVENERSPSLPAILNCFQMYQEGDRQDL